jgi:protein-tyrosine phosphatase
MQLDPPVEVYTGIFIGSLLSTDDSHLNTEGISAIINLSGQCYQKSRSVLNIVMSDIPITFDTLELYIKKFTIGVAAIEVALAQGKKILVHCAAGINRSATLIAFYLIEQGLSYDETIELLAKANKKRGVELLTNPSFRSLLKSHYTLKKNFSQRKEDFAKLK